MYNVTLYVATVDGIQEYVFTFTNQQLAEQHVKEAHEYFGKCLRNSIITKEAG